MMSGNPQRGTIPIYPDVSIQSAIAPSPWWVEDNSNTHRGRLIWAFLPHVEQVPYTLIPIGRAQAEVHEELTVRIEPLAMRHYRPPITLPVAVMPEFSGEVRIVQRAKRRPVLILSEGGIDIPKEIARDRPKWQVSPMFLVAPYYGQEQGVTRAGFPPEFVSRVRRCEFPQFMCERLPIGKGESLLFLNHLQALAKKSDSIELTQYRLSDDAMAILDEWVDWLMTGKLPKNGLILPARTELLKME